uniref:Uncharacterized protein n=1 Tax=viral metagenome TaxID=1070528 RepID=A0A6M3JHA6_9ZZZZ
MSKLSLDDKKWMAKDDARTLMNANEIADSKGRLRAALQEVKSIKKEAEATAKRAGKLAKIKGKTKRK